MRTVAVIQARTSSSRLPGKVLLPIAGVPLAVLAAKRAGNTGIEVLTATSEDFRDNALASTVRAHGLKLFRGSLNDTLGRFVAALTDFEAETLVFRLTADNVFPDGTLLEELREDFLYREVPYIFCNGVQSGLPYGVSVELTRLKYLREANHDASASYDREHVTPYIIRKYGAIAFAKYREFGLGHYRATIDTIDDYVSVSEAFSGIDDPVNVPFLSLVERLRGCYLQPRGAEQISKLVFNTRKLNKANNSLTLTDYRETNEFLIKWALANGTQYFSASSANWQSAEIAGIALKDSRERAHFSARFEFDGLPPSCERDGRATIDLEAMILRACLAFSSKHLNSIVLPLETFQDGGVRSMLKRLLEEGTIRTLGVFVRNEFEATSALEDGDISLIKFPPTALLLREGGFSAQARKQKSIRTLEIYFCSASETNSPLLEEARAAAPHNGAGKLAPLLKNLNVRSLEELYVRIANSYPWIDGIEVSAKTISELEDKMSWFSGEAICRSVADAAITDLAQRV